MGNNSIPATSAQLSRFYATLDSFFMVIAKSYDTPKILTTWLSILSAEAKKIESIEKIVSNKDLFSPIISACDSFEKMFSRIEQSAEAFVDRSQESAESIDKLPLPKEVEEKVDRAIQSAEKLGLDQSLLQTDRKPNLFEKITLLIVILEFLFAIYSHFDNRALAQDQAEEQLSVYAELNERLDQLENALSERNEISIATNESIDKLADAIIGLSDRINNISSENPELNVSDDPRDTADNNADPQP